MTEEETTIWLKHLNLEESESRFLYEYETNYNILQDWIMCYIRTNYIINFMFDNVGWMRREIRFGSRTWISS